jgi:hypothetical protein
MFAVFLLLVWRRHNHGGRRPIQSRHLSGVSCFRSAKNPPSSQIRVYLPIWLSARGAGHTTLPHTPLSKTHGNHRCKERGTRAIGAGAHRTAAQHRPSHVASA